MALNANHAWRDMSVVVGLDYERLTVHCLIGEATLGWRDLSVILGHFFETNPFYDRDSIHALAGYELHIRADYEVIHGADLDTGLDSRLAGSERHNRPDLRMAHCSDRDSIHTWRDMIVKKPAV